MYCALGHGITDVDTGDIVNIASGELVETKIVSITKGEKGKPGEVRGNIETGAKIGDVSKNTAFGIYGSINEKNKLNMNSNDAIEVAIRDEIKQGDAEIICELENGKKERTDAADAAHDERVAREMEKLERRRQRRAERRQQAGETPEVAQPAVPEKPREAEVGSKVKIAGQDIPGVVLSIKGRKAQVAFGQILTTVDRSSLVVISGAEFKQATRPVQPRTVVSVDVSARKLNFKDHIDVRGLRAAEALEEVRDFIDDAIMVGVGTVTILHGKGTGALKEEIRRYLRTVPEVERAADEHADRGGAGITVVTLRMD